MKHLLLTIATVLAFAVGPPVQRDLLPQIKVERAKLPDVPSEHQLGEVLNKIAWDNKDDGWGLSRKDNGSKCPSPVGNVACDILHHKPTNTLYDIFGGVGDVGGTRPQFDPLGPPASPDRVWVAPIGSTPPPPPPPTSCELCEASKAELDRANIQLRDDLVVANNHRIVQQGNIDRLTAKVAELEARPPVTREATCTASIWGIKVPCKVIYK